MTVNNLSWMVGGPQGSGVDTSANIFGRACAYAGLHVYGLREYHSNIKGLHSYFKLRVDSRLIRSPVEKVNLLTTLDAETVARHFRNVSDDGGIIYDPAVVNTKLTDIPTIDRMLRASLQDYLRQKGVGETVNDMLRDADSRGVKLYPVAYSDLLREAAVKLGERQSRIARMVNTVAVAVAFKLLKFDQSMLHEAVRNVFREKPRIGEMNVEVADMIYGHSSTDFGDLGYRLSPMDTGEERLFLMGNQAVALGKLAGGCRFQTYYPITPAADESEYLEANEILDLRRPASPEEGEAAVLKEHGSILVMQTEDEIAAVTMATGGALAGARSATATSSPGFSLMMEGLSFAGANEVPVVVTHYQRGGPSTGLPTRHEQSDLRYAIHSGHGEFPKMIIASGDLGECFYDAASAFNYAERYQLPVIHLVDKALANSNATVPFYDVDKVRIDRGELLTSGEIGKMVAAGEQYKRFRFTESGVSKRVFLGTEGAVFWNTGDEHDEYGHISENPFNRIEMMDKRMRKLETVLKEIPDEEKISVYGDRDSEVTVVSWGSTKGAILDALERLASEGYRLNFIQIRLLHPFPAECLKEALSKAVKKVDVEMNYSGQLAGLIAEHCLIQMDHYLLKYNGRPMTCEEIYTALRLILLNQAPKRMVLTHGV